MEVIAEWTKKSGADIRVAEINLKEGLYEVVAFYSQQAAEKAMKAVFINEFGKLLKTHDLHLLGRKLGAPPGILMLCKALTQHYIITRYPMDAEYSKEDAESAVEQSKRVIEWSRKRLSKA